MTKNFLADATYAELVEELTRRSRAIVVVASRDEGVRTPQSSFFSSGDPVSCLGLARIAAYQTMRRYARSRDIEAGAE